MWFDSLLHYQTGGVCVCVFVCTFLRDGWLACKGQVDIDRVQLERDGHNNETDAVPVQYGEFYTRKSEFFY